MVKGIYCAACIQKIESALQAHAAVEHVRLNFSTGRLSVSWRGDVALSDLFAADITALGYDVFPYDPAQHETADQSEWRFLITCLSIAGFAMGNLMLISAGLWITDMDAMGEQTRKLFHLISGLIAVPAIIAAGRPFFKSALGVLRRGHTNMDVPISLALVLATGMSIWETIDGAEHAYFDSAVMLTFFLLIGRVLDFQARKSARSAATDLTQRMQGFATIINQSGRHESILASKIEAGMRLFVAPGEKIAADGVVESGESEVDASLVTGESLPVFCKAGDQVYAGTINHDAPLVIQAGADSHKSVLSDIVRMMEHAEQGRAKYVRLADRAAKLYTPVVHVMALAAFLYWTYWGGMAWQDSLLVAVTVLIITCPCALGLAVPVVQVLASGLLMRRHIYLKSGDALEKLAAVDMAVFDKTGTLTLGQASLLNKQAFDADAVYPFWSLAHHSAHPLSQALVAAFSDDFDSPAEIEGIKTVSGQGVEGVCNGQPIRLGRPDWCGYEGDINHTGLTLCAQHGGRGALLFLFEDSLRSDAADIWARLVQSLTGLTILSGDREKAVQHVADQLGQVPYKAQMLPADKFAHIQNLQTQGHKVLAVGDGLNDAALLAQADVSMAPHSALDITQNSADIVFVGDHMAPVYQSYQIACKADQLVRVNFWLAIIYNVIAVPIAFMGYVTPMVAAIAMSGSSLLVILNSFRLKWFDKQI